MTLLKFTDGRPFSSGAASFYYPPGSDELSRSRITVAVLIGRQITTAIVDTGETYMILSPQLAAPELADAVNLGPVDEAGPTEISFQGRTIRGALRRVPVTILNSAEDGKHLRLGVLAFVPNEEEERDGYIPSFLGLTSCLDIMKIGIEGTEEVFHFG